MTARPDAIPGKEPWNTLAAQAGYDRRAAALLLRVSLRQLKRKCRRELGCAPRVWIHHARMAAARRLLGTGQSVKQLAHQLGYTQRSNFSRDFKDHFNHAPSDYQLRLEVAVLRPVAPNPAPAHSNVAQ